MIIWTFQVTHRLDNFAAVNNCCCYRQQPRQLEEQQQQLTRIRSVNPQAQHICDVSSLYRFKKNIFLLSFLLLCELINYMVPLYVFSLYVFKDIELTDFKSNDISFCTSPQVRLTSS